MTLEEARFGPVELEEVNPLVHLVLRTYCLALIKSCDFVHARVTSEHYYEVGFWEGKRIKRFRELMWDAYRKRTLTLSCTTEVS